jgi:outer membrane protein assembly factor BamB
MKYLFILVLINLFNFASAENNYYESNFEKKDLLNLKKTWTYKSNIFKDTQTKPVSYENKVIYLDGYKTLRVLSLSGGKEICKNSGKKDRGYHRGIGIYKKNKDEVYAVFVRQGKVILVNIINCKEKKISVIVDKKASISAPILVNNNIAYILFNGAAPIALNLDDGKILWKAKIDKNILKDLNKNNLNQEIKWDVWGGGALDLKYNQLVFSTANAKPSWTSDNRPGPNLLYNSVVSVDLSTGKYKWHFQEIEHDLWNLDLAAPPILLDLGQKDYVAQATKTGQLILLNRIDGKPTEKIIEKKFNLNEDNKESFTVKRNFPDWLTYSRNNFTKNDINKINKQFTLEAQKKISESLIGEYLPLNIDKNYIYYGIHGGTQWPGIAATPDGTIIIPSNNIAYKVKLKNPKDFSFKKEFRALMSDILSFRLNSFPVFKASVKKILRRINKILDYKKPDIEGWNKFVNLDGIPLNKPPWGVLAAIDIKNKKQNWIVPHGSYTKLKDKELNTGSEIFGSPVILSTGIIFMAGTDDKKIRAYSLENGKKIWEDDLPFSSYGSLIVANYQGKQFLIVNSSSGANFNSSPGDAIIAYQLSKDQL